MERNRFLEMPTDQLVKERGILEHKRSRAQSVLEGIASPDWVAPKRATGLNLQGLTDEERFARLAKTIIPIQMQLQGHAIPGFDDNLKQIAKVEAITDREKLRQVVNTGSIEEINSALVDISSRILVDKADIGPFAVYQEMAELVPFFTPSRVQDEALGFATSPDPKTAQIGKNVFLLLNMKTIFNAVKGYITDNDDINNELIHEVVATLLTNMPDSKGRNMRHISASINSLAKYTAAELLARREGATSDWVREGKYPEIKRLVENGFDQYPYGLTRYAINNLAGQVSQQTGVAVYAAILYIQFRNSQVDLPTENNDSGIGAIYQSELKQDLQEAIDSFGNQHQAQLRKRVLRVRWGLADGQEHTFEETGKDPQIKVTRERVRQIEAKAFRELRHPSRSRKLKVYLEPN